MTVIQATACASEGAVLQGAVMVASEGGREERPSVASPALEQQPASLRLRGEMRFFLRLFWGLLYTHYDLYICYTQKVLNK